MPPSSSVPITSRQHPIAKLCRALHAAKGRREHNLFLIEGANAVAAALDANWPLREILATPDETSLSARAQIADIVVTRATPEVMGAAADARTPPLILAIGALPAPADDFDLSGLLLVIDGANDPGNVGTMLRAADAAGAEKVILTAGSADVWQPKVVRGAAGSLFALPPISLVNRAPARIAQLLREKQIPIITAQAHGGYNAFEFAWPRRCALVMGHETRGVSEEFEAGQNAVTIPIRGRAESLNVAMATTVLCYAWANAQR